MNKIATAFFVVVGMLAPAGVVSAEVSDEDRAKIHRAALDYLESQQQVKPEMMARSLHEKFAKRTFWNRGGPDFILENDKEGMVDLAGRYNIDGDRFPEKPRKDVVILDVEGRVASVKVYADDFIDYLHIVKLDEGWKIINALWQFNDMKLHIRK